MEQPADRQLNSAGRQSILLQHHHRAVDLLCSQSLQALKWLDSVQGRGVLKCTLAYTIASLATFVGPLSDFLGQPDGKHVVATISVYFHPARSAGSMIEAILISIIAVAYAELVSILSMVTSVVVGSKLGLATLAHTLVVIVFVGGAFGLMGWVKQRMNNPLVNVGSTLASIAIIAVVTKESAVVSGAFSNQKTTQVLKMLGMGITSAAAVNLLIWPVFARNQLRVSMLKASTALGDVLTAVSASFLCDDVTRHDGPNAISSASSSYRQSHAALLRNLREAKFEHIVVGREKVHVAEKSIVGAIETLAQSIGGLKSAAQTQQTLLNGASVHRFCGGLDLFVAFADMIRPSMQGLTECISQVLHEPVFGGPPGHESRFDQGFRQILAGKLNIFILARVDALQHVYDLVAQRGSSHDGGHVALEQIAASCGHFSFSLQSFGQEMTKYLDKLEGLQRATDDSERSWEWLLWWRDDTVPGCSTIKPIWKSQFPNGFPEANTGRRYSWHAYLKRSRGSFLARLTLTGLRILRRMAADDSEHGS
ncbi:hypothetical protein E4U16_005296 [Claviceps sp. LM84 group G4]|nr:hypothetical protein E4U16_005296 [Claviceps sp. LM84 group G4]